MIAETYLQLMKDPAHWAFEITTMLLIDGVLAGLAWPMIKRAVRSHDKKVHHDGEK